MKRYRIVITACIVLLVAALVEGGTLVNSKHNLSSTGSGSITSLPLVSGGTTEICVFCHTPHTARPDAPLWNRSNPSGPYTVYYSDVISAMGITPESPVQGGGGYAVHEKTRICMSCHDGTIALGSMVNLPAGISGSVAMQGTSGGMMPSSAPGYIGVDLRDDHPVAVKHRDPAHVNPEMKTLSGSLVRLYYDAGGGAIRSNQADDNYIECTSCHDAHDNEHGNFLIDDNVGSKICLSCHNKTGYTSVLANESVHSNEANYSNAYPVPAALGSTVQDVKCMVCHYPHKSGVLTTDRNTPRPGSGKYLLTFQEEQSCYNTPNRWGDANNSCHDTSGAGKGIKAEVTTKNSMHRVGNQSNLHNATEGRSVSAGGTGWLGVAGNGWHVECDDCHNSHTAGRLAHTPPGNAVSSTMAIYGAGGAEPPAFYTAWSILAASAYTYIEPIGVLRTSGADLGVTKEYQICLKCHSSFAWGTSGPSSVSTPGLTDQAQEFNPANDSFHPVMGVNNKNNLGTFKPASVWNNGGTQTMYCSDCHGNDSASPNGPHGSINPFLLTTPYVDTYPTSTSTAQNQPSTGDLCWNCHDVATYLTGADNFNPSGTGFSTGGGTVTNLHTKHKTLAASSPLSLYAYRCVNCHSRVPHGYGDGASRASRAMIVLQNAGFPYEATAGGGKISSVTFPTQQNYTTRDAQCSTVAGCHHNP